MEILAAFLFAGILACAFIWYANETRKLTERRKETALDFAMAGEPVGENSQIIKNRARDFQRFLEGEEVMSRPIPIRVQDDDLDERQLYAGID